MRFAHGPELPGEGPAVCTKWKSPAPRRNRRDQGTNYVVKNSPVARRRQEAPVLSRGGRRSRSPRDGRFIEKLGTFDPLAPKDSANRLVLDVEKAKEWLAKGAQPTDRVARLLDGAGAITREPRNNPQKALPKKKAQERAAAAEAAAAKAAAAE